MATNLSCFRVMPNSILKKGQSQKSLLKGNLSYFKETICGTDSINPHRVAPNTRCDHLPGNLNMDFKTKFMTYSILTSFIG
jgi:hypothetical protein